MEKAFSAQRMDMYTDRQFLLDRGVLLERGLDRPEKLLIASANIQLPDFTLVQMYVDQLVLDVAESEEKAGHLVNALAIYQDIVSFGYKLQSGPGPTSLERMFSTRILDETFQKMAPLLRREGRKAEANAVESALAAARAEDPRNGIPAVSARQSPAQRSGQIAMISGFFFLLCAVAAAVWLICVALLRTKPNLSRSMNWMAFCLGWAPLLLPLSCLGLFLSFFPYSRSIAGYSSAGELFQAYESLLAGVYTVHLDPFLDIWIDHMFLPLIWCSAIMLLGAAYLSWTARQRRGHQSGLE